MPSSKKTIIWEKWRDPFDIPEDSIRDEISEADGDIESEIYQALEEERAFELFQSPVKVVFTQFGMMAIPEYSQPSKQFKFWSGHTNFEITHDIFAIIESTEGVETLDVLSRYRFRVGVGKAFKDREVMSKVQQNVKFILTRKKQQEI